ncbi:arf-GAP with dual PH domain-containing protein 1-like isoform X2 [Mya arenaria]|uniref:arf-GAP with dual PH domain-containing protein 1-like isoform X2 n=1 Tax=Mya arenaria TaxID=6604 RepID=UPI0022E3B882|nr:arf-GAP with dual PH domain-containing protein 1-like isoform X2 [Mya arenaria]
MSDRNRKVLYEILQKDGNKECADCKTKENVDWASCNLGIFLCQDCAGIHRSLGVDHSRVKSIKLDNWDDEQVKKMAEAGNENVNKYYEQHLPKYYKQPTKNDKDVLKIQFIKAKYVRKEFIYPDKQAPYSENKKEGQLFKKGRDRRDYLPRNFIVNSKENCIQYYNKNELIDSIPLDDVNVVLAPEKMDVPNGLQIIFTQNRNTRNIFVDCKDPKEAVDWFTSIRSAKLERRRLAHPASSEEELAQDLTVDFACEGWLSKRGPKKERYRRRWFTLDRRKLMYFSEPLGAVPKGEAYIGHRDAGFSIENTNSYGKVDPLEFILKTSERDFDLKAETIDDKDRWINVLNTVISTPPSPADIRRFTMMKC